MFKMMFLNRKKNTRLTIYNCDDMIVFQIFLFSLNKWLIKSKSNSLVLCYVLVFVRWLKSRLLFLDYWFFRLLFNLCKQYWIDNLTLNGRFERTSITEGQKLWLHNDMLVNPLHSNSIYQTTMQQCPCLTVLKYEAHMYMHDKNG